MRRALILGAGVVFCWLSLPTLVAAQGSSAASIAGTVKDTSGAVLPGVTVEASSPALIEKVRTVVTDDKGDYRILELRPGTYTVTFTLAGFSTFRREGIELGSSFTAAVNVEMKVGGLEETVTVSGQTPLVDVQNTTQQRTLSQTLLDTVPTAKSTFGFVALMPAAVQPLNLQDVGGSNGEASIRVSVHGSKANDSRLLMDGLSYQHGAARGFLINPLAAQEVVIDTGGGGSAEFSFGGAVINMISKDGGNSFSASFFASGMVEAMQSDNLTDELRAQGLTSANKSLRIYDLNGVVGGPVVRDKVWFTTAHRRSGQQHSVANLYKDANLTARVFGAPAAVWKFAPDYSQPVEPTEDDQAHNVRFTWQASSKDKMTFSYDWQWNKSQHNNGALNGGVAAWEYVHAATGSVYRCTPQHLYQATWTRPATSRLLIEAGANLLYDTVIGYAPCGIYTDRIPIRDTAINFGYNGGGLTNHEWRDPTNQRVTVSYVAGSHTFKSGMLAAETLSPSRQTQDRGAIPFTYTFNNGLPTQLTEFVSPLETTSKLKMNLGLFVQDSWRIKRLTANLGLRYEYLNGYAPAFERSATALADAANFPQVDCLPCWHDIYPRVGLAYDVFGDGKTAVKASFGRYGSATTTGFGGTFGPLAAAVNSTTRAWTDSNGNFYPDCDLRAQGISGECQAMSNQGFGGVQIRTTPDPNWITGWGNRGDIWQMGASIDQQLTTGMAVNVGYFRTSFGNFTVTDNLLVTPADYDPYCVTAPVDSRLPSNISGSQMCGFYDIKPTLFGQVNSQVSLASNYGKWTEYYQGVDLNLNLRLPHGGLVGGGWNIGNSISLPPGMSFVSSKSNRCFVVDSPQDVYHPASLNNNAPALVNGCETANIYQSRIKLNGSYPLPWGLQAAAVFQSLPGAPYQASMTYTTQQIQPSLGRPLSGGTRTITMDLLPLYATFIDGRVNQLDLRFSKIMRFGGMRFQGNLDLYNALNVSTSIFVNSTYGSSWLQTTQIMPGRMLKLGFQLDF